MELHADGRIIKQINVGFVGGDNRCIASGYTGSGRSELALTCPKTAGSYQLGMHMSECYGCPPECAANRTHKAPGDTTPGWGVNANGPSFIGAVTVK